MANSKRVLVPLAEGFEEIEAAIIIDVLRRAEFEVVVAGLSGLDVTGAHALRFGADRELSGLSGKDFDAVVLPGGMPGAKHLRESPLLLEIVREASSAGKVVAAICAAPTALEAAGLLAGKTATSYPGQALPSATYSEERVVVDGNLVTSRSPGTAFDFALELVGKLSGKELAQKLRKAMLLS
jgi:4-methyl-5(b-hydroxyethyl)-thiazole monophosphate biosynthesis